MPARSLPPYHRRRHSWPPFSTRGLLAVAPVHFHLNPNPKKRPASPLPSIMESSPPSSSSLSPRRQLLPDIDDDPFAHFLSPMTDEDNPFDNLAFSAGIIVTDAGGEADEKKDRLKNKLARRWAKYVAKYHGTGRLERVAEEEQEEAAVERKSSEGVDEGYMSADAENNSTPVQVRKPRRPGPEPLSPYRTVVREPTRGRAQDLVDGRMRKKRKFRHSWRAPDQDLFTVVEEGEGAVDSEIEQRYFSA